MANALYHRRSVNLDQLKPGQLPAQETARLLLEASRSGEPEAQALLGQILLDGYGIKKDASLAFQWFCIAAAQGHAMACNMVGRCLEHGWGCSVDVIAAASYYERACQLGLDWGMYNLANLLATGQIGPMDEAAAFCLYQQAAELGHAKSMNLVGRYLEEGRIGPIDTQGAFRWYLRSAQAGDFRGQFSLATVFASQEQWSEARYWLLQALHRGHLKFLRKARDELIRAASPALIDIVQAYTERCQTLESQSV